MPPPKPTAPLVSIDLEAAYLALGALADKAGAARDEATAALNDPSVSTDQRVNRDQRARNLEAARNRLEDAVHSIGPAHAIAVREWAKALDEARSTRNRTAA
jgi:uncharacterized membrane protein